MNSIIPYTITQSLCILKIIKKNRKLILQVHISYHSTRITKSLTMVSPYVWNSLNNSFFDASLDPKLLVCESQRL